MNYRITYAADKMSIIDPIVLNTLHKINGTFNGSGSDFAEREIFFSSPQNLAQVKLTLGAHILLPFKVEIDPFVEQE
jgi:hypothetical protein